MYTHLHEHYNRTHTSNTETKSHRNQLPIVITQAMLHMQTPCTHCNG